jgi:hypothetical protein
MVANVRRTTKMNDAKMNDDWYGAGLDLGCNVIDDREVVNLINGLFDGLAGRLKGVMVQEASKRLWNDWGGGEDAEDRVPVVGMVQFRSSISTMLDGLRTGKSPALLLTRSPGDARWVILPA